MKSNQNFDGILKEKSSKIMKSPKEKNASKLFRPQNSFNNSSINKLQKQKDQKDTKKKYLIKSKITSYATFVLVFIGFLCSIIFFEINFFKETKYYDLYQNNIGDYLLTIIQLTTLISYVTIPLRQYQIFMFNRLSRKEGNYFFFSSQFKHMIIELIIVTIMPLPYFEDFVWQNFNYEENISTFYSLNNILIFAMISRLVIIIDIFLKNIHYSSIKMHEILQSCDLEENTLFVIKCLLKKRPYQFFIASLIFSILVFSFGIRICELPLAIKLERESFQSYTTTIWMVMITMTTVGYGDYNPKTIPGRTLGFVLCIWGVFLMSMIVIILFQSLELSYEEKQALLIFNKLEAKKPLTNIAANLIKEIWKLKKTGHKSTKKLFELKSKFHDLQGELKKVDSIQYDYFFEKLSIYFENMSNNIMKLSQIQHSLLQFKEKFDKLSEKDNASYE